MVESIGYVEICEREGVESSEALEIRAKVALGLRTLGPQGRQAIVAEAKWIPPLLTIIEGGYWISRGRSKCAFGDILGRQPCCLPPSIRPVGDSHWPNHAAMSPSIILRFSSSPALPLDLHFPIAFPCGVPCTGSSFSFLEQAPRWARDTWMEETRTYTSTCPCTSRTYGSSRQHSCTLISYLVAAPPKPNQSQLVGL